MRISGLDGRGSRSLYNMSMSMTHVTFWTCALVMYQLPDGWFSGSTLLKHTIGAVRV